MNYNNQNYYVPPKMYYTKKNSRAHNMTAMQQEIMVYICLVALFGGILIAVSCLLMVYCLKEQKVKKEKYAGYYTQEDELANEYDQIFRTQNMQNMSINHDERETIMFVNMDKHQPQI